MLRRQVERISVEICPDFVRTSDCTDSRISPTSDARMGTENHLTGAHVDMLRQDTSIFFESCCSWCGEVNPPELRAPAEHVEHLKWSVA